MRPKTILLLCIGIVISACNQDAPGAYRSNALEEHLQNPLFAEQYFESLVQRMVELVIRQDPIMDNEEKKAIADSVRQEGLKKAKQATQTQLKGTFGEFMAASEWAKGATLYVNDTIYFGPNFQVDPGPSLHVFLTTVVDPRMESFPDSSALDLGQIQNMIADQSYPTPNVENPLLYRTVVLFDTVLERIYAFAQLSPF